MVETDRSDSPTATHPHSCETTSSARYEESHTSWLLLPRCPSPYCLFVSTTNHAMMHVSILRWEIQQQQQQQQQPSPQLAVTVLWALWLNCLVCLDLPCLPTVGPTRKIKVLFAFTCAGSWSEAECQAAESGTAAWPCAEKTEINDTVYRGWYLMLGLWHLF